jgi:exodeoxyribonuclease VII large subunit
MRVKVLESTSLLLNPENVLQRGYSITSMNGRILKDNSQIKEGDTIDTQLYKGSLRSKVVERKRRDGEKENG